MSFIEIGPSVHVDTPRLFANHTGTRAKTQVDLFEYLV